MSFQLLFNLPCAAAIAHLCNFSQLGCFSTTGLQCGFQILTGAEPLIELSDWSRHNSSHCLQQLKTSPSSCCSTNVLPDTSQIDANSFQPELLKPGRALEPGHFREQRSEVIRPVVGLTQTSLHHQGETENSRKGRKKVEKGKERRRKRG
ncbi:uncharacterized protein LOC131218189 [Magnolia sinica]|uniref:uncharacterized protein LOC131218189 n=1 Tax=Magnolia sinica TaxID=86752 RepID=UPI002658202D|nr:uncharacterized protein LOC131218189 [Magnolia sinica]